GFSPLAGVRVAFGVVVALVLGRIFNNAAAEASMAAGALLAGMPAAVNSGRMSLRALGVVSLTMAVSTSVGGPGAGPPRPRRLRCPGPGGRAARPPRG
ncbi:MAG: hypothetical protein M3Y91_12505, partial [Actinomycetota bacterium]|nr:hypothetical protein [Actinomycetota bacterium]